MRPYINIGGPIFVIAIGAILYWAIAAKAPGVNLDMIGLILMVVGAIWLVVGLVLGARRPADAAVVREEQHRY